MAEAEMGSDVGVRAVGTSPSRSANESVHLIVRGVSVSSRATFGAARSIVHEVSFSVSAGEVLAIVGPNGSGKTTLLEALVGLVPRSAGDVFVSGCRPRSLREHARELSYLPEVSELAPELTVRTLLDHAGSGRRRAPKVVASLRVALAVDTLLDHPAGALSRGERQRVALFSVLALERPVVVLDEPFAPFDPLALRSVLDAVRLVAAHGSAVVATVHDLAVAERVAQRVLFLSGGRALGEGALGAFLRDGEQRTRSLEEAFVALLSSTSGEAR